MLTSDDNEFLDAIEGADGIIDAGERVFSHDWDSGGPGAGAGCESVYRYKGRFANCSLDFGNSGPYDSLEEALWAGSLLTVTEATTKIESTMLSATALAKMLTCEQDGRILALNGQTWIYRAKEGKFSRRRGKS